MSQKHYLIIRFSSIGDIVLTTGVLASLKKRFGEDLKITYLTFEQFKDPLEGHPHIDNLVLIPKEKGIRGILNLRKKVQKIEKESEIDLVLDLHSNTRTLALKILLPTLFYLSLDKRKIERFLFTKFKFNFYSLFQNGLEKINERIQRDFESIFKWGLEPELTFINRERKVDKKIFFMPAAAHEKKQWPLTSFQYLIQTFINDNVYSDYKFVVLGGPEDSFCEPLQALEEKYPQRVVYSQGKLSLKEVIDEISTGSLLVGNDTGLCHIAEAMNVPVIMFMGPTSEYYGFAPILEKSLLMYAPISCRPCHHFGAGKCKQSEKFCLTNVTYNFVKKEADKLLQLGPAS